MSSSRSSSERVAFDVMNLPPGSFQQQQQQQQSSFASPSVHSRVKVRVLLHYDPAVVDWFELRQSFTFSSWSMYHHVRLSGRQPDLVAALGHVPASELSAYHALPRERLGKLPFWEGDPNGCPFPENTGAVCEDAPFVVDERTATAFQRPSSDAAAAASDPTSSSFTSSSSSSCFGRTWSDSLHLFVDDAALRIAQSTADDFGGGDTPPHVSSCCPTASSSESASLNLDAAPRLAEPFRAPQPVVKCRTGGHVVCKLLHLRDAFGWSIVDLESAPDTAPGPLPDLRVPVARHAHFLLGSAYRDAHDSARRRSLQFMWQQAIPAHHHVVFIVESTSQESHRLHVHVPNASFVSGDWEPELDGYRSGEPNVVAAARREVHEETGILIDGCETWMLDWAGVRTTVESGGAFTRLQEVLFIVNLNALGAGGARQQPPLHMLHPRVTPRVFNELAPMVPEWHTCSCKERAFLDMCYRAGALRFDGHTNATPLALCVFVHAHDEARNVCVCRESESTAEPRAPPARHFDIMFSTLAARERVLTQLDSAGEDSLFVFSWKS